MLVVGWVKVGDVCGENFRGIGRFELVGRAGLTKWVRQNVRDAEFDVLVGAWCPCFEVRHLHASGRIDAIGGFDETCEHDRFELWAQIECFYVGAHRVNSLPVIWVEESGVSAICFGDEAVVALGSCDDVEVVDDFGCLFDDLWGVGLDVAHGNVVRIGVVIVSVNAKASGFECVADARGAAEEVDD